MIILNHDSPYLVDVKELWRKNSQTFGFFPDGAFAEHASNGWILAALTDSQELGGYLLFRVVWWGGVWPKAVIVHLCVASEFRGKGIGRILVDHLAKAFKKKSMEMEGWILSPTEKLKDIPWAGKRSWEDLRRDFRVLLMNQEYMPTVLNVP